MKPKSISTILLFMTLFGSIQAQNNTFFTGHIYSEDSISKKQTMIPFATLKIHRLNSPDKIIALRISGLDGGYDLKGFDTDSIYVVRVSAPDIEEQSFVTRPNNGQVKSGNLNAHIRLKVKETYSSPVQKQSFTANDFATDKNLSVIKMIEQLPGLIVDNNEVTTKGGGTVRILINGFNPSSEAFAKIKGFPATEVIKSMDYYDLTTFAGTVHDGVLNIRIAVGNEASAPNYKLVGLETYE